ncbi:opacity protein [Novosphingobium sp. Rr 2-17]|uniref:outer membrane protein n=1 Tax=Novosphingobium sp. Rr 2-17 TaxID=555793 RepID=UPI00026988AD|nr:outer membrane beta-barrel protein [Novosphingobium sp. Rr 2-17]EIZ78609.1 opacity protein [Novosphingobium sp. Rr 2-17]
MNKFALVAAAAALLAVPATANAQAYVQVTGGLDSLSNSGDSSEGVAYGVAAGYDAPVRSNMFVGFEGSVSDSTVKECAGSVVNDGFRVCAKTGRDLAAVVRVGTQVGATSKLYVLGGYTNARVIATYRDDAGRFSDGSNLDGFRLGAGYEKNFSDKFFGKIEYRYSNYESDFSRHNVLAGVGVKF